MKEHEGDGIVFAESGPVYVIFRIPPEFKPVCHPWRPGYRRKWVVRKGDSWAIDRCRECFERELGQIRNGKISFGNVAKALFGKVIAALPPVQMK